VPLTAKLGNISIFKGGVFMETKDGQINQNTCYIQIDGKLIKVSRAVYEAFHYHESFSVDGRYYIFCGERPVEVEAALYAEITAHDNHTRYSDKKYNLLRRALHFENARAYASQRKPDNNSNNSVNDVFETLYALSAKARVDGEEWLAAYVGGKEFISSLEETDRRILGLLIEGYHERQIAAEIGLTQPGIHKRRKKIQQAFLDFMNLEQVKK
jgi:hypothetical protein